MKTKIQLLSLLTLSCCAALQAEVKLPNYLTSNMVLQRDATLKVRGTAQPGASVNLVADWLEKPLTAKADAAGAFLMEVATPQAGGPFTMIFSDGTGAPTILDNVLSGDVWIASGQSNMEFAVHGWSNVMEDEKVIATAQHPTLRLLQVQKQTSFKPCNDVYTNMGGWVESNSATVPQFSAIGYLYGLELADTLGVPIGIIDTSWGGTPAEAWTSAEYLRKVPGFEADVAALQRTGGDAEAMRRDYSERQARWLAEALKGDDSGNAGWKPQPVGENMEIHGTDANFDGIVWYRTTLDIPATQAGNDLQLSLGCIDDDDQVFLNGKEVGRGSGWNVPRRYTIPASQVKAGKNELEVRVTDYSGGGGLIGPTADMYAKIGDTTISLADGWEMRPLVDFREHPGRPSQVEGPNFASVLYNAMLEPMKDMPVKGVIWYQGCANVGRADQYSVLFRKMIENWRELWGADVPFYFVQLAGFQAFDPLQPESEWAKLRQAQADALVLPATGMASAIDLGNPVDIHPKNKQEVARRLAALALNRTYGHSELPCMAPRPVGMNPQGHKLTVRFDEPVRATSAAVTGFIVGDNKGQWAVANARLASDGRSVVLSSPLIKEPTQMKYAWADYPNGNLYSTRDFLPVTPFQIIK